MDTNTRDYETARTEMIAEEFIGEIIERAAASKASEVYVARRRPGIDAKYERKVASFRSEFEAAVNARNTEAACLELLGEIVERAARHKASVEWVSDDGASEIHVSRHGAGTDVEYERNVATFRSEFEAAIMP